MSRADRIPILILVLFNAIWALNGVWGKFALESLDPSQLSWARYSSAWVCLVILTIALRWSARLRKLLPEFQFFLPALVDRNIAADSVVTTKTSNASAKSAPFDSQVDTPIRQRFDILFVALLGFATFFCSPLFQYFGLRHSTAVENAVIVAMEPLLSVLLAAIVLRERMGLKRWTALAVALLGFCLLSRMFEQDMAHGFSKSMVGNVLILASLLGEITFTIFGSRLVKRLPSSAVFAMALSFGLLFLTIFTAATSGIPAFWNLTGRAFWGVMWLGPLSTAGGYLVWMSMLRRVPVNLMAMTLFVQPVVGSVFGALFLHEQLGLTQWLGGALIVAAVMAQTETSR